MVDLPVSENQAKFEDEFGTKEGNYLSVFLLLLFFPFNFNFMFDSSVCKDVTFKSRYLKNCIFWLSPILDR